MLEQRRWGAGLHSIAELSSPARGGTQALECQVQQERCLNGILPQRRRLGVL